MHQALAIVVRLVEMRNFGIGTYIYYILIKRSGWYGSVPARVAITIYMALSLLNLSGMGLSFFWVNWFTFNCSLPGLQDSRQNSDLLVDAIVFYRAVTVCTIKTH